MLAATILRFDHFLRNIFQLSLHTIWFSNKLTLYFVRSKNQRIYKLIRGKEKVSESQKPLQWSQLLLGLSSLYQFLTILWLDYGERLIFICLRTSALYYVLSCPLPKSLKAVKTFHIDVDGNFHWTMRILLMNFICPKLGFIIEEHKP